MSFLNCKRLRQIVSLAGMLLISGMLLEVIAHLTASTLTLLLFQSLALAMVLISPVIILLAIVISLIPGTGVKDCMH
ncbi:MAG: hypothetical protein KZQ99_00880 [Candidatus Thiodiazotropha sp. (ex Dulcina madagascariensis)]|nr:hypothetical protein [Candidatus Thiodiazotropha sp. (ex Epidulcina cf. delphinae)]MCU7922229.1 hypothetical protein [Candidatus Thiodiazotropha sp. (ex Dulcina madagascariensis)]MCU7925918.1 hypothetical protein [Candidatus Thiodiazotropha sp. (ex Dulcina madagascariensis)]MCU7933419.1 hypothetical protein [Candidatus Thiodiazotropha sp. (ex Dulcina madagascariensis)]